jgi:hypothetical protein
MLIEIIGTDVKVDGVVHNFGTVNEAIHFVAELDGKGECEHVCHCTSICLCS